MTDSQIFRRGLPVGWPCLYYVTGMRGHAPAPAIVFKNHGNGVLDLVELRWGAAQKQRQGVRHLDDEFTTGNAKFRETHGAWDYAAGMTPPASLLIFPTDVEPAPEELTVLGLVAQGMAADEVVATVGKGWSRKRLADLVERYQCCLP